MRNSRMTVILALLTILTLLSACARTDYDTTVAPDSQDSTSPMLTHIINPDSEVRGVWIASVYNIDYPTATDLSAEKLKAEIDAILDTCEKNGLNTVFFQVRPACDALYKSEIFPVSSYLSSSGTLVFDPLEYIVSEGHRRNIRIHAWINPLRITVSKKALDSLPENSPARQNPDWVVEYADGKLYFDAGRPEVQQLVVNGAAEIVRNYDVDGIVFDDYFYPYPVNDESGKQAEFNDSTTFAMYGSGFSDIADWRRNNINSIIRSVYETVHAIDDECVFGVSPVGVWQNDNGSNNGSATRGFEGYNSLYCDALAWIEGGYIDYISPQLYWTFDNASASYDVLTRWWNAAVDGSDVHLIISHGAYRYEEGEWTDPEGQLAEQITFARAEKTYRGSMFYGYDEINRNIRGASDELVSSFEDEIIYMDIVSNGCEMAITSPENGSTTTEDSTYLIGICDPYYPLTVTGGNMAKCPVSVTKSGYFSLYTKLTKGENVFIFEQNGKELIYTITKVSSSSASSGEKDPELLSSITPVITYPTSDVATQEDILWVSCTAPYNSKVSVNIGGVTTELVPLDTPKTPWPSQGYAAVSYGANAALPKAEKGEITHCGNFTVSLSYYGSTAQATGGEVRVLGEDAALCVKVNRDYTNLKITETSSYYNDYTVQSAGMTALAVSRRNGFYLLKTGGYIAEEDVTEITDPALFPPEYGTLEASWVKNSGRTTDIRFTTASKPAYNGCIEDGRFVLTLYGIDSQNAPMPSMGKNPLLRDCEIIRLDDRVRYSFALYDVTNFYGFDLRYEENAVIVSLRNPIAVDPKSDFPLDDITVVLDAGHGGWDNGAAGALKFASSPMNEKQLNLAITMAAKDKLTALGADVYLTRLGDEYLSLDARTTFLEEIEPDLSVSIHQNSMGYTADITKIRGTLALWCMDSGRLLSDCVGKSVSSALGRHYQGAKYQMLAMCKNPKFPQALIEVGFITSVEEYELTSSSSGIDRTAEGIAQGVLDYFAKQTEFTSFSDKS